MLCSFHPPLKSSLSVGCVNEHMMLELWGYLRRMGRELGGGTAMEYAFVVALISIAAVGSFTYFANEMNELYEYVNSAFITAQN
jgi:Flp pilus assembly pilin Flp